MYRLTIITKAGSTFELNLDKSKRDEIINDFTNRERIHFDIATDTKLKSIYMRAKAIEMIVDYKYSENESQPVEKSSIVGLDLKFANGVTVVGGL